MHAFIYSMVDSISSSNISNLLQVISSWGVQNKIDFLSLSYTRHAEDVCEVTWKMKEILYVLQVTCIFMTEQLAGVFF